MCIKTLPKIKTPKHFRISVYSADPTMKVLIILALVAVASASIAPLYKAKDAIPGQYLIKLKDGADIEKTIKDFELFAAFKVQRKLTGLKMLAGSLQDRYINLIRRQNAVEYIEEDGVYTIQAVSSWGLDRIDQADLPLDDSYTPRGTGNNIHVYILDTGINPTHVDIADRATIANDFVDPTPRADFGVDCNGHGSHCTGTVGGTTYGVAKGAQLHGVRVLSCSGSGSTSGIIDACTWTADTAAANGETAVGSMSLGGGASLSMDDAVTYMFDKNVAVAVAAGNDDEDAINHSPARCANAITVGSTQNDDFRSSFSNWGYIVDIFAPGTDITSIWYDSDTATNTISGTSMATPHVAGVMAIFLELDGSLTPTELVKTIQLASIPNKVGNKCPGSPDLLVFVGDGTNNADIDNCRRDEGTPGDYVILSSATGSFSSPGYDGVSLYPDFLDAVWVLNAPVGATSVTISFSEFDVEKSLIGCNYDVVRVYSGDKVVEDNIVMDKLCGTTIPNDITVSASAATIWFHTDYTVGKSGFQASFNWS